VVQFPLADTEIGFSDVGFRLAFPAEGGAARESLASRLTRGLGDAPYIVK
jgi:hypothetical protein